MLRHYLYVLPGTAPPAGESEAGRAEGAVGGDAEASEVPPSPREAAGVMSALVARAFEEH